MLRAAAATAVLTLALTPAGSPAESEAEVRDLVLGFNAAYERNDLEGYFGAYAEDATVQWWPEGRQQIADYRASWERLIGSGARVVGNRVRDLVVRLAPGGEAAFATYRVEFAMASADGQRSEAEALETDVVHRIDGRWRIVHVHYQTR
jgi:uncharacterized protein (TIGR02246 family)